MVVTWIISRGIHKSNYCYNNLICGGTWNVFTLLFGAPCIARYRWDTPSPDAGIWLCNCLSAIEIRQISALCSSENPCYFIVDLRWNNSDIIEMISPLNSILIVATPFAIKPTVWVLLLFVFMIFKLAFRVSFVLAVYSIVLCTACTMYVYNTECARVHARYMLWMDVLCYTKGGSFEYTWYQWASGYSLGFRSIVGICLFLPPRFLYFHFVSSIFLYDRVVAGSSHPLF